jgi:translation initiation factor 3 subunit K
VTINILLKALTSSPLPDFNLCVSLLDERPINATLDEPDPLPTVLPTLKGLYNLLYRCRFPAFWKIYRSKELENLRDNYTIEIVGFEDAVRAAAIRAVRATFTRISSERLGSYLDLTGAHGLFLLIDNVLSFTGSQLNAYIQNLGWTIDPSTSVVAIPPNPDNQIEATIVQESVKLPRTSIIPYFLKSAQALVVELVKVIAHSVTQI